VGSEEAVAEYRAGVGDVLADAAEPAAVAFACACGRDCFDEAAQAFVGVRGSAAVALVLQRCGVDDAGGDGLDRAVVCRALAGGAVVEEAYLRGPRRDDGLAEQAADVGGDSGRIGLVRRPFEQDLAGGALAQRCDGARVGLGQVVRDDQAVRGWLAGVEVRRWQAERRGGRSAEDPAGPVGQQRRRPPGRRRRRRGSA
jgi:hypothetical protein